jgi:UDPglucose 6-dehydrogenase
MKRIKAKGISVIIYESTLRGDEPCNSTVVKNLAQFKREDDVDIVSRNVEPLTEVAVNVYSRDLFASDS